MSNATRHSLGLAVIRGFTITELLVTIAIMSILAALVIMGFKRAMEASHRVQCMANLKQIGLANMAYANDYNGYIATGSGTGTVGTQDGLPVGQRYWWWRLMPYLGINPVTNDKTCKTMVCPADPAKGGEGYANYENQSPIWKRSYGLNDYMAYQDRAGLPPKKMLEIPHHSKTAYAGDIAWYLPGLNTNYIKDKSPWFDGMPTKWHGGLVNIVFLDGHVQSFRRDTLRVGAENHWIWTGE